MDTPTADRYVVETPENIRFGYDVADIGSRFLAILIDSLIQGAIYVILFMSLALVATGLTEVVLPRPVSDGLAVVLILVLFLIQFGYFLFFEIIMSGQTPGKRLFGLRVVKDNAHPFSAMDSIIRNLVRIIDFFPFAYGIGVLTMFSNKRAKRLGDFAAGTLVVKMRSQVRVSDLRAVPPAELLVPVAFQGHERLSDEDIALARSFMDRRANLVNREHLEMQLAQRFAQKMEIPQDDIPRDRVQAAALVRQVANSTTRV
jgi:uncharacterized RDD family membrane protein YckC